MLYLDILFLFLLTLWRTYMKLYNIEFESELYGINNVQIINNNSFHDYSSQVYNYKNCKNKYYD